VESLLPLTGERLARAEERLRNPAPGSRIEAARDYGIDLTLLIYQLRRTPEERLRKLEGIANDCQEIRGTARKRTR
jgi:hypothetical protein